MASRRIFEDLEEALSREVRRITFHNPRTRDESVLQDTFDPFTGEVVQAPIEANYYDSSADANHTQYPHFFIRLMKTREDRFTGRVVPQYGKWIETPNKFSANAYEIVVQGQALIDPPGNNITTPLFQIAKVQPGYLIRLLAGNNKGTYIVDTVTISNTGDHTISVLNLLLQNMPVSLFEPIGRTVLFQDRVDLTTLKVGDVYTDASSTTFNITALDANDGTITIDGSTTPDLTAGGTVTRTGDVFTATDLSLVRYLVMDPTKPVMTTGICGDVEGSAGSSGVSPGIPLDVYYLVRIDSKERQSHIEVLNRMWEEFNPPRTALPVIQRSSLSASQLLTVDVVSGGSDTINVKSNNDFSIGDQVFLIDDLHPTKRVDGEGFERPFQSKIIAKIGSDQLQLADLVPDTFTVQNGAKIVSNSEFQLLMFHFVDHVTKDVEGSQYWVHEFTFWVQIIVDRLEQPRDVTAITDISTPIEDIDGDVIIDDL